MNYVVTLLLLVDLCLSDEEPPEINACCYGEEIVKKKFLPNEDLYHTYLSIVKWPTNKIHYDIDPHMDPVIRHFVAKSLDYFNFHPDTCVLWVQRDPDGTEDPDKHWVTFWQVRDKVPTMHAYVGYKIKGPTNKIIFVGRLFSELVLRDLYYTGRTEAPESTDARGLELMTALIHEMMHVMGFRHEHQRGDRDCWLYVSEDVMKDEPEFRVPSFWKAYFSPHFPYDLRSIMHYETFPNKFYAHDNSFLGRVDGRLSGLDLDKLNYVYCRQKAYYCDVYPQCKADREEEKYRPQCFREGEIYNFTPTTCTPCHRTYINLFNQ